MSHDSSARVAEDMSLHDQRVVDCRIVLTSVCLLTGASINTFEAIQDTWCHREPVHEWTGSAPGSFARMALFVCREREHPDSAVAHYVVKPSGFETLACDRLIACFYISKILPPTITDKTSFARLQRPSRGRLEPTAPLERTGPPPRSNSPSIHSSSVKHQTLADASINTSEVNETTSYHRERAQ
jgi:hypothetical protein